MPQRYRLQITGSLPLTFADDDPLPQTPQSWHDLLENSTVMLYELDHLTLQFVPLTPEEIAADETEQRRYILLAKRVGERMYREWQAAKESHVRYGRGQP